MLHKAELHVASGFLHWSYPQELWDRGTHIHQAMGQGYESEGQTQGPRHQIRTSADQALFVFEINSSVHKGIKNIKGCTLTLRSTNRNKYFIICELQYSER